MPKVMIVSVDKKETQIALNALNMLESFGIDAEQIIISSDNIIRDVDKLVERIEGGKAEVVIATAGVLPNLPSMIASYITVPVLSVPVSTNLLNGLDTLIAALKAPSKCTAPVLAIDNGENAALMAARILALGDSALGEKMVLYKESLLEHVRKQNEKLREEIQ